MREQLINEVDVKLKTLVDEFSPILASQDDSKNVRIFLVVFC